MQIPTSFGTIRPWTRQDAPALVKYANNRKIWANLRDAFPHPYTEASAAAFLDFVAGQDPVSFFAIATPEEAIGGIGVRLHEDIERLTAELGYWLAEPFWGKGMMTEAVSRFTDFAFERYSLTRIFAVPYATNRKSCSVLEKAGFVMEGCMRRSAIKDGQILDQFLYARIRE
jgi:[ribosomal protein S5]-alanine N-acetyltransferase